MNRAKLTYNLIVKLWPLGKVVNWLGSLPLLGRLLRPLFSQERHRAIIVPVNQAIQGTESVVLPFTLLPALVQRASHRVILHHCMCRQGENCQIYPQDIGCLFLGPGAARIPPSLGRPAGVDEALEHVRRAMHVGLVPLVVHTAFDAIVLDIPFRTMLAICFCCDCCCTVRRSLRLGPPVFWDTVLRLPGLTVTVDDHCTGCAACLDLCHVQAISMQDGHAEIDERCKGCGRCAAACPAGAITLHLAEDVDVPHGLLALVQERTEIEQENRGHSARSNQGPKTAGSRTTKAQTHQENR